MTQIKSKPVAAPIDTGTLVEPETKEFWESVGIFPDSLDQAGKRSDMIRRTRKALSDIGGGNLRLLCEKGQVLHDADADESQLVGALMAASPSDTLLHLREFMHRRVGAVEETFLAHIHESTRKSLDADVQNLGGSTEQLKAFTKLILLYRNGSTSLKDIYYLKLARSRRTEHEFVAEAKLPQDIAERIEKKAARLAYDIQELKASTPARFQGCHTLPGGTIVVSVLRGYTPTVKADFRPEQVYSLHHGFGHVVFSIHPGRNRVDVRSKSKRVAEVIRGWLASALAVKLKPAPREIVSNYDAQDVSKRLLGEYPKDKGVELTGIKFRRSGLPMLSPLTVEIGAHQQSVREDLTALRETNVVQLRNLLDIEHMQLVYDGQTAKVTTERLDGGLVRFVFDNTDWDDRQDGLRDAFTAAFGLPLDTPIDPSRLAMGEEGIYSHLLTIRDESQVLPFQRKSYDKLIEQGILTRRREQVTACRNPTCDRIGRVEKKAQECVKCGHTLTAENITRVDAAHAVIRKKLAAVLNGPKVELGEKEKSFEKAEYYPLRFTDEGGVNQTVAVLVRDSVPDSLRRKLERSSRALLVIKARTPDKPVYLDDAGVGQVSLGYLLAASESPKNEVEARARCHDLLANLHRDHQRRVAQSAQRSYMTLRDNIASTKDYEYETDIFNILRSLFPETIQLGRQGKSEPDGFCGLPMFDDGSLRDGKLWAFTYDAKLAESGKPYPLESGEYRKMRDYIEQFRRVKSLFSASKRMKAHVLISNNIADGRMKASAEYLQGEEGLATTNKEVILVYMHLGFLLRLHELVRDRDQDFRRRTSFLAEALASVMSKRNADGYVKLERADADALAEAVLNREQIHPTVESDRLKKELDE
ncbi:MAG: hypothetical protein ACRC8S_21685 [Fimbriiglobus sp.]